MKLPQAYARGIFSARFVGSEISPKRKNFRIHSRSYDRGFLRRLIDKKSKEVVIRSFMEKLRGTLQNIGLSNSRLSGNHSPSFRSVPLA